MTILQDLINELDGNVQGQEDLRAAIALIKRQQTQLPELPADDINSEEDTLLVYDASASGNKRSPVGTAAAQNNSAFVNSVNSVADMKALTRLKVGDKVRTAGRDEAGDGGSCDYLIVEAGTGFVDDFFFIELDNGLQAKFLRGTALASVTVSIPTDYPTLQDAVNDLHPRLHVAQSVSITLRIESGHVITSVLRLNRTDFRKFIITSVDDEVLCSMPDAADDLFRGWDYCDFPVISTLFNMQGTGRHGLFIVNNSRAYIPPSSNKAYGIKNAGERNVYAYRGSWVSIGSKLDGSDIKPDFSGAGTDNLFSQRGSWIFANNTILTGAGEIAAHCRHGAHLVVNESDLTGAGVFSLQCTAGGFITCSSSSSIDPESWNIPPNMLSNDSGMILVSGSLAGGSQGLGVVKKVGTPQEGYIEYSNGDVKAWKYVEVDSTVSDTQTFAMPVDVPGFAKLYASGANGNSTSPVVGSGITQRAAAAASTTFGNAGGNEVAFRVTEPSTETTNTMIGYMVVLDIPSI